MSNEPVIATRNLTVRFGGREVLKDVNLEVPKGHTLALMGLSGVGKSTTLRCMIGLQKPTAGEIYMFGRKLSELRHAELDAMRRRIGMVFQSAALFDSLTIGDNVAFALREHAHLPEEEIQRIVTEKLKIVDLEGMEHMYPSQLSGGMRKRAGVARAIAAEPEVILYDEPTTGLDPIISNVINELIVSLQKRLGNTAVVVTHDLNSAYTIANEIAFLFEGEIVEQGTPEQFQNSTNPYVVQFREGRTTGPIKV